MAIERHICMGNSMGKSKEKHRCSGHTSDGWRAYQCGNNARFYENDKWWCGHHAPSKVKARNEKSRKKIEEDSKKWKQEYALRSSAQTFLNTLRDIIYVIDTEDPTKGDPFSIGTLKDIRNMASNAISEYEKKLK